jgi:hypothetical protein
MRTEQRSAQYFAPHYSTYCTVHTLSYKYVRSSLSASKYILYTTFENVFKQTVAPESCFSTWASVRITPSSASHNENGISSRALNMQHAAYCTRQRTSLCLCDASLPQPQPRPRPRDRTRGNNGVPPQTAANNNSLGLLATHTWQEGLIP